MDGVAARLKWIRAMMASPTPFSFINKKYKVGMVPARPRRNITMYYKLYFRARYECFISLYMCCYAYRQVHGT